MSAKTKIVVLRMKELIYTSVFVVLGIALILLLIALFCPSGEEPDRSVNSSQITPTASTYIPGIYNTQLFLGNQTLDLEVIVNQEAISSIRLVDSDESTITMYPLLEPALESICRQIYENQSLEDVTYDAESRYTSMVLLEAIRSSLEKAQAEN